MGIKDIFKEENRGKQYKFLNHEDKQVYTLRLYFFIKLLSIKITLSFLLWIKLFLSLY